MNRILPLLLLLFSFNQALAQRYDWLEVFASSSSSIGEAAIEVSGNNVYVAGEFTGSISFGTTVLSSSGPNSQAVYLANFDTLGNFRWAKRGISPTGYAEFSDIDIDQFGNVYLIGIFNFDMQWGNLSLNSSGGSGSPFLQQNGFILKLNSNGIEQWIEGVYSPNANFVSNSLSEISVADSSIYFGGDLSQSVALTNSNLQLIQSAFEDDGYVGRIDLNGNYTLLERIINTNLSSGTALTFSDLEGESDSTFYVSGNLRGVYTLGSNNQSFSSTNTSTFVSKFTNSNCTWLISSSSTVGFSISGPQMALTDQAVYLGGTFSSNISFQNSSINTAPGGSIFSNSWFASKFDLNGVVQELVDLNVRNNAIFDLSVNDKSELFLVGSFADSVNFDGTNTFSNGSNDMLAINLDSDLNLNWFQTGGGGNTDWANSIACGNSSAAYVLGNFIGLSQFGSVIFVGSNTSNTSLLFRLSECGDTPVPLVFSGDTNLCIGQSVRIQTTPPALATFQWLKDSTQLAGEVFRDILVNSSGDYQVIVNGQGCIDTSRAVEVNVGTAPNVSLNLSDTLCEQDTPIVLSGGLPLGGVYKGPGVVNNTFDPSLVGIGNSVVRYVFSNGGCADSSSANIFVKPAPTVFFAPIPNLCISSSPIALTNAFPLGGVFSGPGVNAGQFDPAAVGAGTYNITYSYSDANGCGGTAIQTIEVDTLPVSRFSSLPALCVNGGTYALSEGSPAGGSYSGIGVNNGIFDPSISGPGTFTLDYTLLNPCGSSTATQIINVSPSPAVSLGTFNDVCEGSGAIALSGGTPAGGNYSGIGVNGTQFDPATAGIGTFTIYYDYTDGTGCSSRDSSSISVNALPAISMSSDTSICAGNSITLNASGGNSYLWSTGASSSSISVGPNSSTTYFVTVSNGSNCTAVENVTLTVNNNPIASISGTNSICSGSSTTLTASGGSTFLWSNNSTNPSITVSPSTSTSYSVTLVDLNGCSSMASQTINVIPSPMVSLGAFSDLCESSGAITLSGGTPAGGSYSGIGVNGTQFDPAIAGVGTFNIYYDYADASGCSSRDSSSIHVNALPSAGISNDTSICAGASIALNASGGVSYLWSNGANTSMINVSPSSNTQYFVTVSNASNCTAVESVSIAVSSAPLLSASNDTSICLGETISISAQSSVANYLWNTNESTASIQVSPLNTTVYTVSSDNGLGCITSDTVRVIVNTGTPINIGPDTTLDPSTTPSYTFDPGPGFLSYLWQDNSIQQSLTLNYDPAKAGSTETVSLRVENSNGCPSVDSALVFYDFSISIRDNQMDEGGISILPNPATEFVNIRFDQNSLSNRRLRLFDLKGKLVLDQVYSNQEELIQLDILDSKINKGLYLLNIEMGGRNYQRKIVVQ